MSMPLTLYGDSHCEDTQRSKQHLRQRNIPFREVDIDLDAEAERFVVFINGGFRSTPTIVFGEGQRKVILTEPSNAQLDEVLAQEGLA
ncbi:MAG: glutaredoxin family protein [Anaerolineales bacterium]|nr:glutaredoxin family protein [Anaerolineales bacterium]